MQAAKKAVETIKETAANIGASAKSGFEKTKATLHEKSDKMSAHDQTQKDMAAHEKEEKIHQAEREKQQARQHNAARKQSAISEAHNTGPETEPATIDTPGTQTATHNTSGGPEYEDTIIPPSTWPATFATGDSGLMGDPGHRHGHGLGIGLGHEPGHGHGLDHWPGHGGQTEDMMGSRPIESTTGVDTTAQSAASSGPTFS